MLKVNQKKSKIELKDPHPNKLNCRAVFKNSMDGNYVNNCIENIAKRSDIKYLTKFVTYAQKGMLMILSF